MRRLRRALALAFIFNAVAIGATAAGELNACESEMVRASAVHNVPLGMLYAVGLSETGRGDGLRPYALNVDGRAIYDLGKAAAIKAFYEAQRDGARFIDVGCMQINHYFHAKNFSSVEDMFDPAQNVTYAARFLSELKEREGTWTKAIARYHAGPANVAAQKTYVCRVISRMVESGFGDWTDEARSYCGRS